MTAEERNTQLYQKMFTEQECFKFHLMTLSPAQIVDHAYEYTIREDILLSLEYNNLTAKQASALLQLDSPLAAIFQKYDSPKNRHMDDIWNAVEGRANAALRANFIASRREKR